MKHMLETESFSITLSPKVFEDDIKYPTNTLLAVTVRSDGFAADTTMDIDVRELAKFAKDLQNIHTTLSGEAQIEEPYGMHMRLSFSGDGRGHISVKGYLHKVHSGGGVQKLRFENAFDQTCLGAFAEELVSCYAKYTSK